MKIETNHVPGPWTIGVHSGWNGEPIHCVDAYDPIDGALFEVAAVWGIDGQFEESERSLANCRLISAAPDLLEALQYARRFLKPADHDIAFVDAAIQKATGAA